MVWTPLGKRKRSNDDDGGVEAEVRSRNARGRNPRTNFLPGDHYKTNEGQRHFPKCILGLPDDILSRIFAYVLIKDEPIVVKKNTMDIEDEAFENVDKRGYVDLIPLERLGLLGTCVHFRALARHIFYIGNDYVVAVENFNAKASMAWWSKVCSIRQQELDSPSVRIATCHSFYTPKPKKLFARFWKKNIRAWIQQYQIEVSTGRDAKPLTPGTIRFDIEWTPNWVNLKQWLHSYYKGQLPAYQAPTSGAQAKLKGIENAFDLIKVYLEQPWLEVAKSLKIIRANLTLQDEAWAPSRPGVTCCIRKVEEISDDDEENQTAETDNQQKLDPKERKDSVEPQASQYHDSGEIISISDDEDEDEDLNDSDDETITQSDSRSIPRCNEAAACDSTEQTAGSGSRYILPRETLSSHFRGLSGNDTVAEQQHADRSDKEQLARLVGECRVGTTAVCASVVFK